LRAGRGGCGHDDAVAFPASQMSLQRLGESEATRGAEGGGTTIAALVTPVTAGGSHGGVGIVRVSGPEAFALASRTFRPASAAERAKGAAGWTSHLALYGTAVDPSNGEALDECLVLPMRAPRSYTCEDVVEFHTHGGPMCASRVLGALLQCGARPAERGEFTLRAFLNGRIDLAAAESVAALVNSRTTQAASSALRGIIGGDQRVGETFARARAEVLGLLAEVEARVDFPDDEMEAMDEGEALARMRALRSEAAGALKAARRGLLLDAGLTVAIAGRPNVGKSSLLNAWCGSERAIVTDIPGTTRDLVEARVELHGAPVRLLDTAGIRDGAADAVEALGIARAREAAHGADVLIVVCSAEDGWTQTDEAALVQALGDGGAGAAAAPAVVLVVNKVDVRGMEHGIPPWVGAGDGEGDAAAAPCRFVSMVGTSARSGRGLGAVQDAVAEASGLLGAGPDGGGGGGGYAGGAWSATQRQVSALQRAEGALARLETTIAHGMPSDFWTVDLRDAAAALGELTGDDVTEDVLGVIFSRFCIGK